MVSGFTPYLCLVFDRDQLELNWEGRSTIYQVRIWETGCKVYFCNLYSSYLVWKTFRIKWFRIVLGCFSLLSLGKSVMSVSFRSRYGCCMVHFIEKCIIDVDLTLIFVFEELEPTFVARESQKKYFLHSS